ncbi:polyprenyl synthetase family protein, partial [Galactobacter sp.]|uniref:polyprenyl synthetase family protein n=1 Tax=Galactobacter sp. TaxID=2676125 RepID=UPI00345D6773
RVPESCAPPSPIEFTASVTTELSRFLADQSGRVQQISPDAVSMMERITELSSGGKRLRPLFAYWGARCVATRLQPEPLARLGAALELFQAAALIHDDLIDRSDTRRGGPSVHRRFEAQHREAGYALDPAEFGIAAALLAGDLALSLSEQLFRAATDSQRAQEIFDAMRTQVMVGQYLDVLEEQCGPARNPQDALSAALRVVEFKSAKYSVENPVLIGAAHAGADTELLSRLSAIALPLGIAFQLRDDELGVFGDPRTTGKPAGDDLREGKRTALVALTLQRTDRAGADTLNAALGNPDLDPEQVEHVREIMRSCGAFAAHEALIDDHVERAFSALEAAGLPDDAAQGLREAGTAAVRRRL